MRGWATPLEHWQDPPACVIAIIAHQRFPEEEARKVARSAILAHGYADTALFLLRAGNGAPAAIREEFDLLDVPYLEVAPNRKYWVALNRKGEAVPSHRHSDAWFYGELRQGCGRVVYLHTGKSKPPMSPSENVKVITKERE